MAFSEFLLGKRERISWVEETSFGSGGTMSTGGYIIGLNAEMGTDFKQNWQEVLTAGADDRYVQDRVVGPLALPFTITFTPTDWKFLRHCGYDFTNTGSPTVVHTGTIQNAINSFNLEWAMRHTTPVVLKLTGCTALGATITFNKATGEGEGNITVAMRCVAKAYTIGASVTTLDNDAITRDPFKWRHVKVTLDNNEITEVNSGEIIIDQGIDVNDSRYCNATLDRDIGEPIPKIHRITGKFNFNVKDNTFMALWNTADEIANCSLDFTQGATNKIEMDFTGLRLDNGYHATALEGVTAVECPFTVEKFTSIVATDILTDY